MPILRPTKIVGRVETIAVNRDLGTDLSTEKVDSVPVSYAGFEGDGHAGLTRKSCVRVRAQYKEGTEIRNTRQISIVSSEDLAQIADTMGIPEVAPEWIGANLCVSGIPDRRSRSVGRVYRRRPDAIRVRFIPAGDIAFARPEPLEQNTGGASHPASGPVCDKRPGCGSENRPSNRCVAGPARFNR